MGYKADMLGCTTQRLFRQQVRYPADSLANAMMLDALIWPRCMASPLAISNGSAIVQRQNLSRFPREFHVPTHWKTRPTACKIPNWNLEEGAVDPYQVLAVRFHARRRRHAFRCAAQPARRTGQHRHHARVCPVAGNPSLHKATRAQRFPNWNAKSKITTENIRTFLRRFIN